MEAGNVSIWFMCYERPTSLACEWIAIISRIRLPITDGHADVDNVDSVHDVSDTDAIQNLPPGQSISISSCRFVNCKGRDSWEHGQAIARGLENGFTKNPF